MSDEHPPIVVDDHEHFESDLTLSRVGRRDEWRLLAFVTAAALVFVATATAKPWGFGTQPPGPSGSISAVAVVSPEPATAIAPPSEPATLSAALPEPATGPVPDSPTTVYTYFFVAPDGTQTSITFSCTPTVNGQDTVYVHVQEVETATGSAEPSTGPWAIDRVCAYLDGTPPLIQLVPAGPDR
jgi:hypothetical protein